MRRKHFLTLRTLLNISNEEIAKKHGANPKTTFDWGNAKLPSDTPEHAEKYILEQWEVAKNYARTQLENARKQTMETGRSPEPIPLYAFTTDESVKASGEFPEGTTAKTANAIIGLASFLLEMHGFKTEIDLQ